MPPSPPPHSTLPLPPSLNSLTLSDFRLIRNKNEASRASDFIDAWCLVLSRRVWHAAESWHIELWLIPSGPMTRKILLLYTTPSTMYAIRAMPLDDMPYSSRIWTLAGPGCQNPNNPHLSPPLFMRYPR